jgi:hypothetical protein
MRNSYHNIVQTGVFLILFLFGAVSAFAQKGIPDQMHQQIEQVLKSRFHQEFLTDIYNRTKNPKWYFKFGFYDPYGTLKDCYIFLARPYVSGEHNENTKGLVGIYKSGSIIWMSKREIETIYMINSGILGVMDLNRDGKVDIITKWYAGMGGEKIDLWIYEWDGTTAKRINQLSNKATSALKATLASVELVDLQPDGIKEITGEDYMTDDSRLRVYSWDGQQYGIFGVHLTHPLPRNRVKAELHARVTSSNDHLQFHYRIHIKKSSLQSAEQFAVKNYSHKEPIHDIKPPKWYFSHLRHRLVNWQISQMFDPYLPNGMRPGTTDSLFAITSTGLPRPGLYYLKGNNGDINYNTEDLVTNSVQGTTLCPYDPPNPFDAGGFTDTLRSFTTQACNLKWIDNKGICQSLQTKLKNVQKQLGKGKTKTAINDLQAFINEVEAQKGKHLTGEGYGLLYFNGVYLMQQLEKQ